jgi:23S rRNA pseudouridine2605 synthase
MEIRINKFLSQAGVASRRAVDKLIEEKRVKIKVGSSLVVAKVGDKVDPDKANVLVNNKPLIIKKDLIYYAVNKPVGYTSSARETYADKLVVDLVPSAPRVYPVGRLDKNSHGLIILTNDGDLANELTHPRFEHEKEYEIKIKSTNEKLKSKIFKLKKGIKLQEGTAKFDKFDTLNIDEKRNISDIKVVLHQGWKRQIRRMCEKVGLEVLDLKRTRIGKLKLEDLEEGKYIIFKKTDIL